MKDIPYVMKLYDLTKSKPVCIPWLPQTNTSNRKPRVPSDRGIFSSIKKIQPQAGLWDLLQYSMPPFLAKRFHIVNIKELRKDYCHIQAYDPRVNYISLSSYFMMFNVALGIPLLDSINIKHFKYYNICDFETSSYVTKYSKVDDWKSCVDDDVDYLKMLLLGETIRAPDDKDLCTKASEFLLEPCVLIQLPWKPVLLHQWLTAALAEVLMFERDSVEFRHWPLPNKMLPLIKSLLALVRDLKEKILLGFVILCQQVNDEINLKHPDMILDDVVLPSLPTLQFLITGKAHKMMKLLKISAFSNSTTIKDDDQLSSNVQFESYSVDVFLAEFYNKFCYSYYMWNRSDNFRETKPFPHSSEFDTFYQRFKSKSSRIAHKNNSDSQSFISELKTNKSSLLNQLNSQKRIDLTVKTIKEHVIDAGKIPGLTLANVEKILCNPKAVEQAKEILIKEPEEFIHVLIRLALQFNHGYALLLESEKENSSIAQIITLQLKVLERNMMMHLVGILSIRFKISPVATKSECRLNSIDIDSMIKQVQEIHVQIIANQNRNSLWLQLPSSWRNAVSLSEKMPGISILGIPNVVTLVTSFENRIGRLVYNTAIDNFEAISKGGESNPDWSTIQYVLPCFVGSYLEECMIRPVNLDLLKFIHEVIKLYETRYHAWKTETQSRDGTSKVLVNTVDLLPVRAEISQRLKGSIEKTEWYTLNWNVRENLRQLLGYHTTNVIYITTITGIDQVLNYIHMWPTSVTHLSPMLLGNNMLTMLNTWWKFTYDFTLRLFTLCVRIFNPPNPESQIERHPKLGHLYSTAAILTELEAIYDLSVPNATRNVKLKLEMDAAVDEIKQERYEIIQAVMNSRNMSKKEVDDFVKQHKNAQLTLYSTLKKYRKLNNYLKLKMIDLLPLSKVYPNLKPAVKHYITGDFASLEKMLPLFAAPKSSQPIDKTSRLCRNCGKLEGRKRFLACRECLLHKYPDVHLFCGRRCQEARWKEEHMAEHLEFELGLGQFSPIHQNN